MFCIKNTYLLFTAFMSFGYMSIAVIKFLYSIRITIWSLSKLAVGETDQALVTKLQFVLQLFKR